LAIFLSARFPFSLPSPRKFYMAKTIQPQPTSVLVQQTVDNLHIDASYLRMYSRDQADPEQSLLLETCSQKIRRVATAVERLARTSNIELL
jgi:hypothetical protein